MRQIVPLYTWAPDHETYNARIAKMRAGDVGVVTSAYSGPGLFQDPHLVQHIDTLTQAGITVMGYVHCLYGRRSLQDIMIDVERWFRLYGVRRIFLDEWAAQSTERNLGFVWGGIRAYTKGSEPVLAVNPGTRVDLNPLGLPSSLIVVSHENQYLPDWTPLPHEAALCWNMPDPISARRSLEEAGWKWGYCTDDGADGNPWDE